MKKFLLNIILFLSICGSLFYLVFYFADGYADGLYLKFTSPRQSSLILGTSKATQGLQPQVINEVLGRTDIYNYAFTVMHSPYGPAYFESIKKKLDHDTKDGVFILQVDPYSIASQSADPDDIDDFRENNGAVGQIDNVNIKPNLEYLIWHYPYQYNFIFKRRLDAVGHGFLHDNGWLEMNTSMESSLVEKRTASKVESYYKKNKSYRFSEVRLEYLRKIILYLKNYGKVYLVRMPLEERMLILENSLMPNFDQKMAKISKKLDVSYLNYQFENEKYNYMDGNHLTIESGALFSTVLAEEIKRD